MAYDPFENGRAVAKHLSAGTLRAVQAIVLNESIFPDGRRATYEEWYDGFLLGKLEQVVEENHG